MGSEAYIQLPVIDFSVLSNQNEGIVWESIKTQVFEALQEYGCFQASIDGVSPELHESVYGAMQHMFDLPLETKSKNTSNNMFYGYVGSSLPLPLYESMGIDEPYIPQQVQNFTNLMWPQGNPQLSKDIHMLSKRMWELDRMVKKMVFQRLDVEKYLNEHVELTDYALKLMRYRVPEAEETNLGLHVHADSGLMTILHQNQVEGLEIQTKDQVWLKLKVSPHLFTVMAGETLTAWLNGQVYAPLHRVILRGNKARFSLALFALPKTGYTLKAIDKLVDDGHPLLFKPFEYGDFIRFLCMEGLNIKTFAVKAYCGLSYPRKAT